MNSRTSFFNPTVFRKDVTRFAPVWILCTLGMLMYVAALVDYNDYVRALNVTYWIRGMAVVNLAYALLNAQLLFGDLFNARMCSALHAMPLRRECWFATHTVSGLFFSLVPNTVFSLVVLTMLGKGWSVALWFLLAVELQYLLFFGIGVFSVMLTGNRFAQVLIYVLINFLSILALWFVTTLYEPLMFGVSISGDRFYLFCPVVEIAGNNSEFLTVKTVEENLPYYQYSIDSIALNVGWGYLVICAAIGIALLAVALVLYRKRDLETAGDFIAFKVAEPVFLVLFTLGVGAFFQLVARTFDIGLEYLFLAVGIAVGFFVGRMLLKRTTRVFQPKAFLGFGGIVAVMALSLVLVKADAFGIVRYVPDAGEVASVTFTNGYYHGNVGRLTVTDREDIEKLRTVHQYAIGNGIDADEYSYHNEIYYTYLYLDYERTDGSHVERRYSVPVDSEAGGILKDYYSTVECLLGVPEAEARDLADDIYVLYIDGEMFEREADAEFYENLDGLMEAVIADCKAGNMIQDWAYHHGDADPSHVYIELQWQPAGGEYDWSSFNVFDSCTNTLNWLTDNGYEIGTGMYGG